MKKKLRKMKSIYGYYFMNDNDIIQNQYSFTIFDNNKNDGKGIGSYKNNRPNGIEINVTF